ncbi:MAG: FliA/WhiG family RNA polymerase sigma factor [Chitinispirillales bacterium]|nr:FliA/WhiG family RNA polymerase sigma factor [Chitinispirillales bacterium]
MESLWHEFKTTGSKVAKDKLLVEYSHIVKYTAQRLAINLPPSVDRDDLYSAGIMGLIKAVDEFEPGLGYKFETYAGHKIRGAILDELRALDWVPRTVRQKARNLKNVFSKLEGKLGRQPYDEEVCRELGLTMDAYEEMLSEVTPITIMSLDEADHDVFSDAKEMRLIDRVENPDDVNPHDEAEKEELKNILKKAIADLHENERLVISLYHYEELTFKEIGELMSLTESRVSQIHSKAMLRLQSGIQPIFGYKRTWTA